MIISKIIDIPICVDEKISNKNPANRARGKTSIENFSSEEKNAKQKKSAKTKLGTAPSIL
jgi:hypothetical protein